MLIEGWMNPNKNKNYLSPRQQEQIYNTNIHIQCHPLQQSIDIQIIPKE
jgi:hypothetical protein